MDELEQKTEVKESTGTTQQQERYAFKVTNSRRTRTVGVIAQDFPQLKSKCEQKFGLENLVFVLDEDGCEVDSDYLPMVSPDTKLMCLGEGDTWASIKRKEPASEREEENIMTLIEDLRKKKLKAERNLTSKPREQSVSVQVGWSNYSFKEQRYQLVKTTKDKPNSGPRQVKLDRKLNMSSVLTKLKDLFFPQGKSPLGSQKNFTFNVGTYQGEVIDSTVTVEEFVTSQVKPRLYLLSKAATVLSVLDSSSDSDFELPRIEFHSRSRPQGVSATVTSASIDNINDDSLVDFGLSQQNRGNFGLAQQDSASNEVVTSVKPRNPTTPGILTGPVEQAASIERASGSTSTDGSYIFLNSGTPTIDFKVSESTCQVCYDRPKDTVLLLCWHPLCHPCAVHFMANSQPCPFCRGRINKCSVINC